MSSRKPIDCSFCVTQNLDKDVIALNKKLIHRQVERFMCLVCMADYFETTTEELEEKIEHFKEQDCGLFG